MHDRIRSLAKKYEEDTARFLADIVSIPSLSGHEKAVVDRIGAEMKRVGFDEVRIDGLGSVIGRIGHGPRLIAMDAHIDTVDVGNRDLWSFDPHHGHVRDGKVWGRGAADQKGGMAGMVTAGRIWKELGLAGGEWTVLVTGTVMEEDSDGLCWDYLVREEKVRPEVCVITEPTGCRIYRGHRGRMEIEVEVTGLSAHGSAPERGVNAVYRMAPIAAGIEQLNERLRSDPFLGKGTVVLSHILGTGPSLCAVPDRCRIHLDRRLTVGETRESALAEIAEVAGPEAKVGVPRYEAPGYTGKVFPMDKYYPTWVTPPEHPAVRGSVAAYRGLFGEEPVVDKWTFSTNGVAIMGLHGIPCVGLGPGFEEQAHAPDEFCPVEHLSRAAAFYAAFPAAYLAAGK
jgi:putative selenium metabolism hydrolase